MKKLSMFLAAAAFAVSANAQTTALTAHKASDNVYIGGAIGVQLKSSLLTQGTMSQFDPNLTFIVGKDFTTVFGLRLEGMTRLNCKTSDANYQYRDRTGKTFVDGLDVNLLGTFNLGNLFAGYKGKPRQFEFIALYGFGWEHMFGRDYKSNCIISKAGIDVAYNFGKDMQYQVFLEPSITYQLESYINGQTAGDFKYNWNNSNIDLKVGFLYKFKCSNGTHNFAFERLRDQGELDSLNAVINGVRGEVESANATLAANNAQVAELQKQLTECQNKPAVVIEKLYPNLQPSVRFKKDKSNVEVSQMSNIQMIADYMKAHPDAKVKIDGYASMEGTEEHNKVLSEKRAAAVKKILVKKYKISEDRIETEGLGATSKLSDVVEFNRVTLFNDTTK